MPIQRMTCFKLKNEEDIPAMLEQYKTIEKSNTKDGKPYILSVSSHKTINDPRNQDYNVVATTTFANMEDFKYYDEECEEHKKLKAFAKDKVAGPPLLLFMET